MLITRSLSALAGLPFSPPAQMRSVKLNATSKDAREIMREGLCHKVSVDRPAEESNLGAGLILSSLSLPLLSSASFISQCDKWIPLDSTKNLEALVPELFWWKVSLSLPSAPRVADSSPPLHLPSPLRTIPSLASSTSPQHAKKCHNDSRMEGDRDCYLDDSVFRLVSASKIANSGNEL